MDDRSKANCKLKTEEEFVGRREKEEGEESEWNR